MDYTCCAMRALKILERHGFADLPQPTISDQALANCREELTDERLEYLGERYRSLAIYQMDIPFHKYLNHPDQFDRMAKMVRDGGCLSLYGRIGGQTVILHTMN